MKKPSFKITKDIVQGFNDAIEALKHKETLVGIPAEETSRTADENGKTPMNNATLLMIHENGSPAANIPERPVVKIGLWDSRPAVTEQFKKAAVAVLEKGQSALDQYLERAGIIASNQIKLTINNQIDIAPIAKSTLQARRDRGFMGTKALIVSGQLRNAITYVVRGKKWGA